MPIWSLKKLFPNLQKINPSFRRHKNYRDYYDAEAMKKISEFYKKDIELLNYAF
jgi:hypothetical protein